MRSFHWIVAFIILTLILLAVDQVIPHRNVSVAFDLFIVFGSMVFGVAIISLALKLIYEVLYFILYAYRVESQQLVVSKGVIWRSHATFPLAKLTDVYVERNPLDLIFFISTLQITTAAATAAVNFGGIEGLPYASAISLQTFITELAASVQPEVSEAKKESVLKDHLPPDSPTSKAELTVQMAGLNPAQSEAAIPPISGTQLEDTLRSLNSAEKNIERLTVEVEALKDAAHAAPAGVSGGDGQNTQIERKA